MISNAPFFQPRDYQKDPFIVIWEVTRACALKCLHCRADAQYKRDPRELNINEAKTLIDQIQSMNNPLLVFTGGDPLERDDLLEIVQYAVKKGVRVSMTPSATPNVTKDTMKKAKDTGLSRWAFSIDGPNKEIHDFFRGTRGSFDRTIEAIQYLHELKMPLQINTVISQYNIEYLEEMRELMEKLNVVLWSVFFLVPVGRGQDKDMISPAEHEKVFRWLYKTSKTVNFDIKTTAAQHYRRVVLQHKAREQKIAKDDIEFQNVLMEGATGTVDGLGRAPKGVNDGNGFIFISHIGDVYPSGLLPIKVGNVKGQALPEIYRESPILKQLRDPDQYKGKCGVCEFRHVCGGSRSRAYAATGDYLESEPYCVYIPKVMRKKKNQI
ncbi:TIGR04053 family radical SAM/SPASM domain-containing protein [Gracilibacillus kekensis]|uniref:Radical SAM protein, BA_1875 family n=1 Tax=Gracilibacillus kekensis TaxID=1027249 RepID=A0A1M7JGX8_9BACI|nr:TIGR04053 family radical SAM/SPASM domain-containing protein [Gracilibacillus kekensis]SHM52208.1 radical SAM protein, BA_1875 family [Gracilibacillus kekensis]